MKGKQINLIKHEAKRWHTNGFYYEVKVYWTSFIGARAVIMSFHFDLSLEPERTKTFRKAFN